MKCRPEQTRAIVVGIEEYPGLPSNWWLSGAALDAIRFVNWLLARLVPPEHIRLCLSSRDQPALLKELTKPVPLADATTSGIIDVLREVDGWKGDLLIVYWGGHGSIDSIDKSEPRRLLFANASSDNPVGLSVIGLLAMLDRVPADGILNQVLFVDACATFHARARFKKEVDATSPPYGSVQNAGIRRFEFFASQRGEAAAELKAERTGAFSKELLKALAPPELLKPLVPPPAEWPPDLAAVARSVQQVFLERLTTTGGGTQTPYFTGRDFLGSSIITQTPESERLRRLNLLHLILERVRIPTEQILAFFRATFPDTPKELEVQTLGAVIDFLIHRPLLKQVPGSGDWPPEAELAERIRQVRESLEPPDPPDLAGWIADVPSRQLLDLRRALAAEDQNTRRFLLIELGPGGSGDEPNVTGAWLYREGSAGLARSWQAESFPVTDSGRQRIARILQDVAAAGRHPITIEFVADDSYLASAPYTWKLDAFEDLGSRYPIVVRWRGRLAQPWNYRGGVWRETAERLFKGLSNRATTKLEWLPAQIEFVETFFTALDAGEYGDLLMAGQAATGISDQHPLMFALVGGAPAVSWWTAPVDEAAAQTVLKELLCNKPPTQLPVTLHEGRRSKDPQSRTVCAATVVLWDHPQRNPYD